jgi:hypothetical protein
MLTDKQEGSANPTDNNWKFVNFNIIIFIFNLVYHNRVGEKRKGVLKLYILKL